MQANHVAAVKTNGTLWTWGSNKTTTNVLAGCLGNGTTVDYSSPVQVGALTNWRNVACGYSFTAAVKTDGTLWTWGIGSTGQPGNGSRGYYSSPIQVGALTDWKQISCGTNWAVAVKFDGTIWSWGAGANGNLGNNTNNVNYSSPVQIGALTNWKQVSAGSAHHMAIKTDGTLWGCGYNSYFTTNGGGQLGNGTTVNYSSPIQIGSLNTWAQVATGNAHTVAIRTNGTLWAWGLNNVGQLGNNTITAYSSPIQIGSLTNWKRVAGGYLQTIAIKTDGTLWTWGYSNSGELGNNTSRNYSSPVQIGALTTWKQIGGFNQISIAIADGYI